MSDRNNYTKDLLSEPIFDEKEDGGIRLSEKFHQLRQKAKSEETISAVKDEASSKEKMVIEELIGTDLLYDYMALKLSDPEFTFRERLQILQNIDRFTPDYPVSHGAPENFLPIKGKRIELFTKINRKAIIYIWDKNDSKSEIVKDDLLSISSQDMDGVALFSVYWPKSKSVLEEMYRVNGAPTVLMFVDGEVDVRLVGAQYRGTLKREIEKISQI